MRILVTSKGENEIKDLTTQYETLKKLRQEKQGTRFYPRRAKSKKEDDLKSSTSPSPRKKGQKRILHGLLEKLELDQTRISMEELQQAKPIKVKLSKISFQNKKMTEKYDTIDNKMSKLITTNSFHPNNTKIEMNFDHTGNIPERRKFALREILTEDSYKNLKMTILDGKRWKEKSGRIDESNFRSTYEESTLIDKLNKKLEKKINPDRINLIHFLNRKSDVSKVLIDKICDYDEEKINRINKICQILFHNEDRRKLLKGVIQGKLTAQKNREKIEYKNTITNMGDNMKQFGRTLHSYNRNINEIEKYRDIHNDIQKNYWKKYHLDRLQRKTKTYNASDSMNNFSLEDKKTFGLRPK